ncbi:inositol monophosphatase family protein [Halovulum sp. GXIMD14794]
MTISDRLTLATDIAREAGSLARQMRRDPGLTVDMKGHQDFVTAADRAVEDLVRKRIAEAFPEDGILGEEGGFDGPRERLWIIDPIDGTTNFMRGMPEWAVSIGWADETEVRMGVIFAPDLDAMAVSDGETATLNGQPMKVSTRTDLAQSMVQVGWSRRAPFEWHTDMLTSVVGAGSEYRRVGAATIGLLGVAAGWSEAYYEHYLNIWDAAAGIALVRGAGGSVTTPPLAEMLDKPGPTLAICAADHPLAAILPS